MTENKDPSEHHSTDSSEAASTFPSNDATVAPGHDADERLVRAVESGVDRILQAFDEKLRYDASKQEIIDRLHEELVGHRADLVGQAVRPFILGMIRHHGEIGKLVAGVRAPSAAEMPSGKVCDLLESLQQDVEDVLAKNGVSAYRADASERFDPVRQTVVGSALPTDDEARSGTIAACLAPGFERDGRILVKARVSVYRYPA